ncbi:hypothetical protein [Nocardia asteroides]|uniref:hypothetical protein n=1 Tax=Nocardia asteroides TaxID=1824 RepID=UPI0033E1861F
MRILDTLRRSAFGRRARHDFAETRETVEQMLARIDAMDVDPAYAHAVGPDAYETAKLPVFTLQQIERQADGSVRVLVAAGRLEGAVAAIEAPQVDGGRPMHDLDFALVMGGAR